MSKMFLYLFSIVLVFTVMTVNGESPTGDPGAENVKQDTDPRQLVSMPARARGFMRDEMLEHMAAVNAIIGYLAANDLEAVAEVAESKMGKSSMGKHRGTGMGPGRFMPLEMRNIGWGMHESASELARVAKEGDLKAAYAALQKVTSACVACHYSYRTQ